MTTLRVPAGFSVESHAAVGSTNAVAFERAAAGAPSGLWTIAARQTSGRGRLGRTWTSEPGNLFCSLLLREGLALLMTSEPPDGLRVMPQRHMPRESEAARQMRLLGLDPAEPKPRLRAVAAAISRKRRRALG